MSRKAVEQRKPNWFLQAVAEAGSRLLLVDYEGTIAPPSPSHDCAPPYPGIPDRLKYITNECSTRVIAISGRPAHEVSCMLGTRTVSEIWGGHGLERLHFDGRYEYVQLDIPTDALEALRESELALRCVGLGKFAQVTLAGVSVHWRGMSDLDDILDVRASACHIFRPLAVKHPALRFIEFEGGVELRLRGATKADSFRRLLSGTPANTPVAYIGDDRLDNGSYNVLSDWRPAFFMRPLPNANATQVHPHPGDEVIRFLDDWIHTIRGNAIYRAD